MCLGFLSSSLSDGSLRASQQQQQHHKKQVLRPRPWPAESETVGIGPAIWVSLCPPGGSDATKAFDPLLWSEETSLCLRLSKPGVESYVPLAGFVHHLTPVDTAIHAQNHLKWLTASPQAEAWRDSDPCSQSHSQRFQSVLFSSDVPHKQRRLSFWWKCIDETQVFSPASCTPLSIRMKSPAQFETIIIY